MLQISILGAGNVARFFYEELSKNTSVHIKQCYNRKGISLHPEQPKTQIISDLLLLASADIYVLAISDEAIETVADLIPLKNVFTVHTSGATDLTVLKKQPNRGVWYPLQTFSESIEVEPRKIPFCIEASENRFLKILEALSRSISSNVYYLSSAQRKQLHVAAVFSNNFTNYMMTIAHDICEEQKIPYQLLIPLIEQTMRNGLKATTKTSQTGPAIRNDQKTIKNHLKLLPSQHQILYETLTEAIQNYYGKKL